MSRRLLIWIGSAAGALASLGAGAWFFATRQMGVVEPSIRQRVIEYLAGRFDSQIDLSEFHVRLPRRNLLTALFRRDQGFLAEIEGGGLVVRYHQRTGLPPLFQIKTFRASIGFEGLLRPSRRVSGLEIDGMEINVPPRDDRASSNRASQHGPIEHSPIAILGSTAFTTSGVVLNRGGQTRRTIGLQVGMRQGEVADLLKLAMAGKPLLTGRIVLDASLQVPPMAGKVKEKLMIDGSFTISDGLFLKSQIRQQLDGLSRRAQGEPKNLEIEDVMSDLAGKLHVEDENVSFSMLNFAVPGARVALSGNYSMQDGAIDFDGSASLDAKISNTTTGWKRILVKPFDPLFACNGAGTFLPIEIRGNSEHPKFSVPLRRAIVGSAL